MQTWSENADQLFFFSSADLSRLHFCFRGKIKVRSRREDYVRTLHYQFIFSKELCPKGSVCMASQTTVCWLVFLSRSGCNLSAGLCIQNLRCIYGIQVPSFYLMKNSKCSYQYRVFCSAVEKAHLNFSATLLALYVDLF